LKHIIRLLCVLGFIAGLLRPIIAQTPPSAGIVGTVADKSGAVFPGATVTITGAAGKPQSAASNERGEYSFAYLPPGTYAVSVAAQGFKTFSQKVEAAAGAMARVDITMEPAEANSSVEVVGQKAAGVETDTAQVSGTITQKEVVETGLNGRNFTQLIALAPGVSNQTGQDEAKVGVVGSTKYSVNGGRVEYNTFDVDGSDLLNVGINGSNSTLIVYPSLDAIQEVKVLTSNYGAMYGRTASGTVLVATKSGGQDFHGDGYYFGRNEVLNARNFFDETQGAPLYRRSDVGGTIGGPLYIPNHYNTQKDKTFFFWSEEYRAEKSPYQYNQAVPSVAERSGDFSDVCPANNKTFVRAQYPDCPAFPSTSGVNNLQPLFNNQINGPFSQLDRNAVAILNTGVIPAPNATSGCNSTIASCYDETVSPPTHWREELFRFDHNFTEKTRLTFRYIHDSWDTVVPTPQWGLIQNNFPTIENQFAGPGISLVARLTQTLSPTLLNEVSFSYTNSTITLQDTDGPGASWQRPSALDAACQAVPFPNSVAVANQCPIGYLFNNGFDGKMPGIVIGGTNQEYGGTGFGVDAGYMPWSHNNPIYDFADHLSKVIGRHNLQFGAQFVLYQRNQTNSAIGAATGDMQGILTFSNEGDQNTTGNAFADFLYHGPGDGNKIRSFTQDSSQGLYHQRYQIAEPYLQDDWRVNSRLTVNLGVRLSLFGTYHTPDQNEYNWVPGAFSQAIASNVMVNPFNGSLQYSAVDPNTGINDPVPINLGNLDPALTNGLVHCGAGAGALASPSSTMTLPASCIQGHLFNWAPRIGFAWDPKGDGKTSIRAGYGIFYEHGTGNEANTGSLEASSPLVLNMTQNLPYSYACIGGVGANCNQVGAFPPNVTSIPTTAVWPYVQQWSFTVQRELPDSMVATFGYVGSKGTHLTVERNLNQLPPVPASGNPYSPGEPFIPVTSFYPPVGDCQSYSGTGTFSLPNGAVIGPGSPAFNNMLSACYGYTTSSGGFPDPNTYRPYMGLGEIISLENSANSTYNGFQTTLRRTAGPLTLGVSYSYSHSLDNSSDRSDATFVNSYDLASNKASSNFDQRNLLNINYIYRIPFLQFIASPIGQMFSSDGTGQVSESMQKFLKGWELSGITVFQSGTPFSVVNAGGVDGISVPDNAGVANTLGLGSYPDLVGNPKGPTPGGGNNGLSFGPLLLNPGAFAAPTGLTFGDAGRNTLNNPSRLNFDMALLKHIKIREKSELELRLETFNTFNHTQFRIYDSNLGNQANNTVNCYGGAASGYSAAGGDGIDCLTGSAFLHPVDAHRPRTVQFGLKYSF